jgi:hypothetical protein
VARSPKGERLAVGEREQRALAPDNAVDAAARSHPIMLVDGHRILWVDQEARRFGTRVTDEEQQRGR